MEYLFRTLQKLKLNHNFNYHSKSEKLKVMNMSFADDLLIFTKGDLISVELVLKAFKEFSLSTSMDVNPSKCKVYFGNVCKDDQQVIPNLSKFPIGPVPFKYLGVPMSSKKLAIHEYMILVDKIVVKTRYLSSKLLCYGGRVQLIKVYYLEL
ncbi:uncharacterized protein LOC131639826 [Vicia villosa]|uniref:uncharacterized protein LOC131639826 n=1 Tax=Vicia villosa TaxID=3911 RepID=UPI00273CC4AB|nr:uncharacterized protein LOC131639826 [Vicia villosa]